MISESIQEHILYDKIYQYLWKKTDSQSSPPILIPETVIFIRSMPVFWYYSDRHTNEIRKKKRENILKHKIKDAWLSNPPKNGIVAYFLHFMYPDKINNLSQVRTFHQQANKRRQSQQTKSKSSILMKFLFAIFSKMNPLNYPLGFYKDLLSQERITIVFYNDNYCSASIQAIWTRQITIFSKRISKKPLSRLKINCYERCCTFDGPDYLSEPSNLIHIKFLAHVKDFQSQRISEQINQIVSHLDSIAYGKLNLLSGTFYFKVNSAADCYFLFCGNLKFEEDKNSIHNFNFERYSAIQIPKTIDNIISVYKSRPAILDKDQKCIKCNQFEKSCNFREIPYNFLIDAKDNEKKIHFENEWPKEILEKAMIIRSPDRQMKHLNSVTQVPLALGRLHQKLNPQNYISFKVDDQFQNKKTSVCIECYMELVDIQQKICLKKIRDKNDFQTLNDKQKVQKKVIVPRLHYFQARFELLQRKKKSVYNSKASQIQQLSERIQRNNQSEMTLRQYILIKSSSKNPQSKYPIQSLASMKTEGDFTRSKLGSSQEFKSRKAFSEFQENNLGKKQQALKGMVSNLSLHQLSPYAIHDKK